MDWLVVDNNISQTQLQKEIEILFIIEHYFFLWSSKNGLLI